MTVQNYLAEAGAFATLAGLPVHLFVDCFGAGVRRDGRIERGAG